MTGAQRHPENALFSLLDSYARPYWPQHLGGLLAIALSQLPQRVPALIVGVALDAILLGTTPYSLPLVPHGWIPTSPTGQIWLTVGILATGYAANWLLYRTGTRVSSRAYLNSLHDVRVDSFGAVVDHEMHFFDDRRTGDIISVLNNDVNNLQKFGKSTAQGVEFFSLVAFSFAFMFLLNWQLALALLCIPFALWLVTRWYTTAVEPRYATVRETVGSVNARIEEVIDGIGTVKSHTREDHEAAKVGDVSSKYRRDKWDVIRLRLLYNLLSWLISNGAVVGTFALGAYWIHNGAPGVFTGSLTAGTLVTFLLYGKSFYFPLRQLMINVSDDYENARSSSKRIVDVLNGSTARSESGEVEPLAVRDGRVEYDSVSFTYQGVETETISDVSFTADAGSTVGIVGPTGAGKSTIVKLLFRFYDPDSGSIRVDGRNVTTVDPRALRRNIGYVSQDPLLFYGTIRENVAYATDEYTESEVVEAAKLAGAHEFITDLEDGYDTHIGERGDALSGGQRQRIAIARALLRDPAILVLDEATSHVDHETERRIQESLSDLSGQQTTFVIAHRLSTVRNADQIVVLYDGRLSERGTHDQLVANDGVYADLWHVQVGAVDQVSSEFFDRFANDQQVMFNE